LVFNLHFMKVSTENDNNFGYEKITVLVDNMPLTYPSIYTLSFFPCALDMWNNLYITIQNILSLSLFKIK